MQNSYNSADLPFIYFTNTINQSINQPYFYVIASNVLLQHSGHDHNNNDDDNDYNNYNNNDIITKTNNDTINDNTNNIPSTCGDEPLSVVGQSALNMQITTLRFTCTEVHSFILLYIIIQMQILKFEK